MKRRFITSLLLTFGLAAASQSILNYQINLYPENVQSTSISEQAKLITPEHDSAVKEESKFLAEQQATFEEKLQRESKSKQTSTVVAANTAPKKSAAANQANKTAVSTSRGGTGLQSPKTESTSKPVEKKQTAAVKKTTETKKSNITAASKETKQATYSSAVQLLDWWKSGRSVFSIGTTAKVTDLYTGKTFMAKRTMGTNHADAEAVTKEDTNVIKSIWGGFSWARRPVILTISGKKYAASMSAMPHAGLDSKSAYAVVNNRSGGYGTGQNLDVIKGNGMDGHFDIHFLNSTRHKDGQEDPQHQAAVLKAAGK